MRVLRCFRSGSLDCILRWRDRRYRPYEYRRSSCRGRPTRFNGSGSTGSDNPAPQAHEGAVGYHTGCVAFDSLGHTFGIARSMSAPRDIGGSRLSDCV